MIGDQNEENFKFLDMKLLSDIESGKLRFPTLDSKKSDCEQLFRECM
jgi:hypothetical protein